MVGMITFYIENCLSTMKVFRLVKQWRIIIEANEAEASGPQIFWAPIFVGIPKVICAETRLKIHTIHSAPPISTVTYMIRLTYFVVVTCIIRKDNS